MCVNCQLEYSIQMSTASDLDRRFEELARRIYSSDGWSGQIDQDAVRILASELVKGLEIGFDGKLADFGIDSTRFRTMQFMTRNVFVFSGFKTYRQLSEISQLLFDEKGNFVPFNSFLQAVKRVNNTYNVHYLNAEYNHAVASSQMAVNWQDYMDNIDVAPFLKYVTAGDERVREEHRGLDGTIKRKDDPFWRTWYPPNGWNCRCDVIELVSSDQGEVEPAFLPDKQPLMFKNNVGIDGVVFPDTHPYFDVSSRTARQITTETILAAPQIRIYTPEQGSGTLSASPFVKDDEIADNFRIGSKLADNGYTVELLPYLDKDKMSNPDAKVNGRISDFKWPQLSENSVTTLASHISAASKQGASTVVLYLQGTSFTKRIVGRALNTFKDAKRAKNIDTIIVLTDSRFVEIPRSEIYQDTFWDNIPL